jgi:hypothetical protein
MSYKSPNDNFMLKKKKEKRKAPNLVVNDRFQVWWSMEREEETFFSPPSTFQPKRFFFNLIPIDF